MAVMVPRDRWTDERLDEAFNRIDADIRELRVEMKRGFERIEEKFDGVQSEANARFDSMNQRFDAMQRTMIIGFVTLFASIVASMIGTAILT
ncbi:MAG TPA: hypothetical protein VJU14_09340 [Solirubrobacterales bacterium]|nr:hypothetical protein [Solirubrobacterales bacterium]